MNSQSVLDASFKQAIGLLDDFSTLPGFLGQHSIAISYLRFKMHGS
jgi:hypothetical protein